MSQSNMKNQHLPNGIPTHLNGMDSSHSSRGSSPSMRPYQNIPSSQLPPMRTIPTNQLPPTKRYIDPTYQNRLTTPSSSPKPFGTSTPLQEATNVPPTDASSALSPITTGFTHSTTSHFSNVPSKQVETGLSQLRLSEDVSSNSAAMPSRNGQNVGGFPVNPGSNLPMSQSVGGGQQVPVNQGGGPGRIGSNLTMSQSVGGVQQVPVNQVGASGKIGSNLPMSQSVGGGQQVNQVGAPGRIGSNLPMSQSVGGGQQVPEFQVGASGRVGNNLPMSQSVVGGQQVPEFQVGAPGSIGKNLPVDGRQQFPVSQAGRIGNNLSTSQSVGGGSQFPVAPSRISNNAPSNQEVNKNVGFAASQPFNQGVAANHAILPNRVGDTANQEVNKNVAMATNSLGGQETNKNVGMAYQPPQPQQQWYGSGMGQSMPQQKPVAYPPQVTQPPKTNVHANRYPAYQQPPQYNPPPQPTQYTSPQYNPPPQPYQNYNQTYPGVVQTGFNKLWGADNFDLLQCPNILPTDKVETPRVSLGNDNLDAANCHPDIFRCTVTKIPESSSLLQKSRLPLGVLIHPFRDLNHLPVIQCNTIVRCRACRTYINPFVYFVDHKRWKCNLCYRINELPEEFQYDPVTKTYGDPSRRPEVKTSTIEYIAPAEYMLRPPQPAVYLFLLDVSRAAVESGYLHTFCGVLSSELSNLPGDARTHIGFIAYDSKLHFYSLADGLSQPHEMTVLDVDDVFLPCPDNLLVNLQDRSELVRDLLAQLPTRYNASYETSSALGAALQAAHKMMAGTGGRVTVFQSCLPTVGPGALTAREDPSQRAAADVQHLNPANDFYKRLALECSGQQIAVDLFLVNSQYVDVATVSGISRFSGGCVYHFPLFKASRQLQNEAFERSLRRYLTRKIGFEAVMRIRCTRGLAIHTFHGNFFVRSTDLLSLPNINPDAGFGMQVSIEENLSDVQTVCFQAALLYTSSKGERRIRVHTMCLPVVNNLSDVINSADQQCIVGLLAKMAVDRSMQSSLSDAREAFLNVAIDVLSSYKVSQNVGSGVGGLLTPRCLRLLPLYISALLKHTAFRTGISTRLDDRVKAMCDMKTKPLQYLIQQVYPDLYPVHNLKEQRTVLNDEEEPVPMPPHLQLTARSIDSNGAYLLDTGEHMFIIVCPAVSAEFLNQALGVPDYNSITDQMYELPTLGNEHNRRLQAFVNYLNDEKPMNATLQIMRDNSPLRGAYLERFVEDRMETALSYHEFLQHLKTQIK